eukprot:m.59999 g.59999  ORF g.59999 m.59999 type:complete len:88 (+) comp22787_c2_seq2:314-577(+)
MSLRANLELFKFTTYVFFPIGMFYYFNLPEFYDTHVRPNIHKTYPTEGINVDLPKTREGNLALLAQLKQQRLAAEQKKTEASQSQEL